MPAARSVVSCFSAVPSPRSLRRWAMAGLLRAGLIENDIRREQRGMLAKAFGVVTWGNVEGDYLEFGVFRGENFLTAWDIARRHGQNTMRFHAFDSFDGLPDPKLSSVDSGGEFVKGQFSSDRSVFEQNLRRAKVDTTRVTITEGFYDTSLRDTKPQELGLSSAAIVWVDCDLYSSTVDVLDFITDLLRDGSVLIFDDWYCFHSRPDRGEQRACAEWLERNPSITLVPYRDFHWGGQSFVVNRDED